jgi:hypothetical protein
MGKPQSLRSRPSARLRRGGGGDGKMRQPGVAICRLIPAVDRHAVRRQAELGARFSLELAKRRDRQPRMLFLVQPPERAHMAELARDHHAVAEDQQLMVLSPRAWAGDALHRHDRQRSAGSRRLRDIGTVEAVGRDVVAQLWQAGAFPITGGPGRRSRVHDGARPLCASRDAPGCARFAIPGRARAGARREGRDSAAHRGRRRLGQRA